MPKIKLDHTSLETVAYIARAREISTALAAAAVFAPLAPRLAPFDALVDDLETENNEYTAAVQTCKQQLTERDDKREEVEAALRQLANASEAETTDTAQLQNGGWHLRGTSAPVGPMPAPTSLSATGGDMEGEVDLVWDSVSGRDTYLGEQSTAATGPWTQFYVGKKSSATATALTPGTSYWFRIRAVGAAGPGPWSDVVQKRAT